MRDGIERLGQVSDRFANLLNFPYVQQAELLLIAEDQVASPAADRAASAGSRSRPRPRDRTP